MEAAAQTVFLVEDEEAILEGIADFLRRRKFSVTTANCFRDAQLALAAMASPPDFVITDVRLPDGNGLDLVRDITSRQPRPRIIVITGHLDKDAVEHARTSGADAVLLKPFPLRSLLAELRGGDPGASTPGPGVS
jgi:DNA-binding response OmpR family regulator